MNEMVFLSKQMISGQIYEVRLKYWAVNHKHINITIQSIVPIGLTMNGFERGFMWEESDLPAEYAYLYEMSQSFIKKLFPYAEIVINRHKFKDVQ